MDRFGWLSEPGPSEQTEETNSHVRIGSVHSPAPTPEALHAIIEDASTAGISTPSPMPTRTTPFSPPDGLTVRGRDDIRAATAPLLALRPHMTIVVDHKPEARHQSDGTWQIALDNSLGPT
jgi:hypothetical protein